MKYIYVIGTENKIKIGFSKHPLKRLKQLQTGNCDKLQLYYQEEIEDSKIRIVEHLIHRDLKQYHKNGEWFNISVDNAINAVKFAKIRYNSDDNLELFWKYGIRIN